MAREFARSFYKSKAWKKAREYIFNKYDGLCVECGKPGEEVHHIEWLSPENINDPEKTLGENNLILLCRDCHFNIHKAKKKKKKRYKSITTNGTYFDDNGELCKCKTYIVYGAPASGKSTYVKEHKSNGDLVVDLDLIMQSISMEYKMNNCENLLDLAIGIRDYIYTRIESKSVDSRNTWIIGTLPNKKQRTELEERFDATLIFINETIEECLYRAEEDTQRIDKELQREIINEWFANYQA